MNMVKVISNAVGLFTDESTKIHVYIHGDTVGTLVLANTPPPLPLTSLKLTSMML